MTLRTEAVAAYTTSQASCVTEARTALGLVLTPFVATALTVADMVVKDTYTLIVFTDGDVHLGVQSVAATPGWLVYLVTGAVGEWTQLAQVTSLAQLGKILPGLVQPPVTTPAWSVGIAVIKDALYTYGGSTWRALKGLTTQVGQEPPNAPALWVKVTP